MTFFVPHGRHVSPIVGVKFGVYVTTNFIPSVHGWVWGPNRVARFSTTKYGKFLSVDPSKSSPPNVSIYNSVHVAIRTQIPYKQ